MNRSVSHNLFPLFPPVICPLSGSWTVVLYSTTLFRITPQKKFCFCLWPFPSFLHLIVVIWKRRRFIPRGKTWYQVENNPGSLFSTNNLCHKRHKLNCRCKTACADFVSHCRWTRKGASTTLPEPFWQTMKTVRTQCRTRFYTLLKSCIPSAVKPISKHGWQEYWSMNNVIKLAPTT